MDNQSKPRRLSELVEGENTFESNGYSTVKVTKNGVEEYIELPIKSTGVAEFQRELANRAPRPPVTKQLITKGSPEGKELGLVHDRMVQIFDTTDEDYVNALERHNSEFVWQVVIFALDVRWVKKDGTDATTYDEKKRILESSGITGNQANQVFADVLNLTRIAEEQEDFLHDG